MLIVGMMGAIIGPAVQSGIDNMRFRTSVKQLVAILRYCRSKAIATKEERVVKIDMDKGSFEIGGGDNLYADEKKKGARMGVLPDGAVFTEWETPYESETSRTHDITFFPKGNATGGTLRIEDRRGKLFEVIIDRVTGRVKIKGKYE